MKLALVGIGKITRDQHVPAIADNRAFELVAAASPNNVLDGVPNYRDIEALLDDSPHVEAVAICTPPQVRYAIARRALEHGCHVLLEKPPGATVGEVNALIDVARRNNRTLFATWHSRAAAGVDPARRWLEGKQIHHVQVTWREDVRVWHPGQTWIWQAGGLGVFDPGINALSVLTHILPGTWRVSSADLAVPSNCETPIAATLQLLHERGIAADMTLDFLYSAGAPAWNIEVKTREGSLLLSNGGAVLSVDGNVVVQSGDNEYRALYAHFARLVAERRIDVDLAPLTLVADAFLCSRRTTVNPFIE